MSNDELRSWIRLLNSKKHEDDIFIKKIGKNVFFGKVWYKELTLTTAIMEGHDVYFITNETGVFISCVYYGGGDLHFYTMYKNRNKGYISKALKESILPHIFWRFGKKEQIITVSNEASERVAIKVGFKPFNDGFKITSNDVELFDDTFEPEKIEYITEDRAKALKAKLNYALSTIEKIQDELDIYYDDSGRLEEVRAIKNFLHDIPLSLYHKNRFKGKY